MADRTMLIQVSPGANSNKFYEVTLGDDDTVTARWGRVGATGQSKEYGTGRHVMESLVARKRAKGYELVDVVDGSSTATNRSRIAEAARVVAEPDFRSDSTVTKLIEKLSAVNAHSISVASGGKITVEDGQVRTPLGVLSRAAISRARAVLSDLAGDPTNPDLLASYLKIVPQDVGRRAGWENSFLAKTGAVRDQFSFLDQLEQSVDFAVAQSDAETGDDLDESAFRMRLAPNEDPDVLRSVRTFFEQSKNASHVSSGYKVSRIFDLRDTRRADETSARMREVGNVLRMWHGTRASNVLSILAQGMVVPSAHANGRMFGDGIYLSEQSTKSLNYSVGFWGGGKYDDTCYMLLTEAATGTQYRPKNHYSNDWSGIHSGKITDPKYGPYNSVYVKAGTAGVRNHECVIWDVDQVHLQHLVEFTR